MSIRQNYNTSKIVVQLFLSVSKAIGVRNTIKLLKAAVPVVEDSIQEGKTDEQMFKQIDAIATSLGVFPFEGQGDSGTSQE